MWSIESQKYIYRFLWGSLSQQFPIVREVISLPFRQIVCMFSVIPRSSVERFQFFNKITFSTLVNIIEYGRTELPVFNLCWQTANHYVMLVDESSLFWGFIEMVLCLSLFIRKCNWSLWNRYEIEYTAHDVYWWTQLLMNFKLMISEKKFQILKLTWFLLCWCNFIHSVPPKICTPNTQQRQWGVSSCYAVVVRFSGAENNENDVY